MHGPQCASHTRPASVSIRACCGLVPLSLSHTPQPAAQPPHHAQAKALHGEQYLELHAPLPLAATVVTRPQVVDVQDKGRGAVAVLRAVSTDSETGKTLVVNEFTS